MIIKLSKQKAFDSFLYYTTVSIIVGYWISFIAIFKLLKYWNLIYLILFSINFVLSLVLIINRNKFSHLCVFYMNIVVNVLLAQNYIIAILIFLQYILFSRNYFLDYYDYYILLCLYVVFVIELNFIFCKTKNEFSKNRNVLFCLIMPPIWFIVSYNNLKKTRLVVLIIFSFIWMILSSLWIVFSIYSYAH